MIAASWQQDLLSADEEMFNCEGDIDPEQEQDEELQYEEDEDFNNPEYNGDVNLRDMGDMAAVA